MKIGIKKLLVLMVLGTMLWSCSKTEDDTTQGDENVEQSDGISAGDLESYDGDLGIIFNTRSFVRKGYRPSTISVSTSATEGDYDQQITLDPFTNLGRLSVSVEDLSEAQESELRNGVELDVRVLNASNNVIATANYSSVAFQENGNQIDMDATNLDYVFQELHFKEDMPHHLQLVNWDGSYGYDVVAKPSSAGNDGIRLERRNSQGFPSGATSEQFYILKIPNTSNEFALYSANSNLNRYLTIGNTTRSFRQSGAISYPGTPLSNLESDYRFIVERTDDGLFMIKGAKDGNPLRTTANPNGTNGWHTNTSGIIQYFRIVALDVAWSVEERDTKILAPIFPAVDTSFGFNSTLRNCGSGSLEQEIGVEREVTTTFTNSFTESVGLSSRVTTNVDVSVSATAEASFFGAGGSVTGEVSAGLEVSVEASTTTTVGTEESVSETNSFFSNRTVTVPAGSASLVYDAYQTYSNVRVPYVKRLKLTGVDIDNNQTLSGNEIATQLQITQFRGAITEIGSNFIIINIEGNMFMDNIVDTQTEVRDVEANCGG